MSLDTITGQQIAYVMVGSYRQYRYTSTLTMIGTYQLVDDDLPVDLSYVPSCGKDMALTEIEADFKDGIAHYVWTYEGVNSIFFDGEYPVLELNGEVNQDPITFHPRINEFIAKYSNGFLHGRIDWKLNDPDNSSGRQGLSANGTYVINNISPLFGVDSYQSNTASYAYEKVYTKDQLPDDLISGLGYIDDAPPNISETMNTEKMSSFGERNWLYSGVRIFQAGNAFVVRRYYLLSGLGGWMPQLYGG